MVGVRQLLTPHMLLLEELISPALGVEIHLPDHIGIGPPELLDPCGDQAFRRVPTQYGPQ